MKPQPDINEVNKLLQQPQKETFKDYGNIKTDSEVKQQTDKIKKIREDFLKKQEKGIWCTNLSVQIINQVGLKILMIITKKIK